ncbi:MAG: hypothetical protein ABSB09_11765 [Acidimicrobiales bacterium]|jgi:hypothetical protein
MPTRDDLLRLALSAACIAIVAVSSNQVVDVVAGLPLAAYFPGAVLVSTLDPQSRLTHLVERQMWIVGASFGLAVVGGLVLNLAGGLTRTSWLVWIGAVVVVCTALKFVLPVAPSLSDADVAPDTAGPATSLGVPGARRSAPGQIGVSWRQGLLLLGAAAICAASLVLSVHTDAVSTRESFVQAWVVPRPIEDVRSTSVELGVRNHLGNQCTFLVRVTVGKGTPEVFSVHLADGASWTHLISRQPTERVVSTVSTTSRPSVVTNRVLLATPVA